MKVIGHEKTKKILGIAARSAIARNMSVPHMLFAGAPGCGKTSMARELAKSFRLPFLSVMPEEVKDNKSALKILERLDHTGYDANGNRVAVIRPTILFFDEIHNIPAKGQEILGLAMERFILESGQPNKFIWIPYFTLVGATTKAGNLTKPFRDRLKLQFTFEPYEKDVMLKIVEAHAIRLGVAASPEGFEAITKRSRGTPRVAVSFLENIRDRMVSSGEVFASVPMIEEVFSDLGIDSEGFTHVELKIMRALLDANGPLSLDNLSIITEEDVKTIRASAEPYLIKRGMIGVSGRGRVLTGKGTEYIRSAGGGRKFVKNEIPFNAVRI